MNRIEVKPVEIRDHATCISALAVRVENPRECGGVDDRWERWLLSRVGFGVDPLIVLVRLDTLSGEWDALKWCDRTMRVAHQHINKHTCRKAWPFLQRVVDVRFILDETDAPQPIDMPAKIDMPAEREVI